MVGAFVNLFGEELQTSTGPKPTAEALKGKTVGIYFSAHWCPPCRGFTPVLADSYTESLAAKGFEVVFVSSDRDEESFTEYFSSMPWKALPYSEREKKNALSKKFKVNGIPTLVILDPEGNVIVPDGRSAVMKDPKGEQFPWKPKPFAEILGSEFIGKAGSLGKEAVEGKVLGLYFSAHWCPPCRGFTPQLAEWYKTVSPKLPNFEIIFLSSDKTQEAFDEYFAEMPWIAVPFSDRQRKEDLSDLFEVQGIPTFVIVDKDGKTITTSGRGIPRSDPEGAKFPWYPAPVKDVQEDIQALQETPSLVFFLDTVEASVRESIESALEPVAKEYQAKAKEDGEDKLLFFSGRPSALSILNRLRKLAGQPFALTKHEHPMVTNPDRANVSCDGCGSRPEGAPYTCAQCNFDFCEECNAKAGQSTPVAPACILYNFNEEGLHVVDSIDMTSTDSIRAFAAKFCGGDITLSPFESS